MLPTQAKILVHLIILLLLPVTMAIAGGLYKWTDEQGNVIYSDRPPADVQVETIEPPPGVDTQAAQQELEQDQERIETIEQQRQEREQAEQEREAEQKVAKANCQLASDRLSRLVDLPRVYVEEADGTRRRLDEAERQQRIQEAHREVQEYCQ